MTAATMNTTKMTCETDNCFGDSYKKIPPLTDKTTTVYLYWGLVMLQQQDSYLLPESSQDRSYAQMSPGPSSIPNPAGGRLYFDF